MTGRIAALYRYPVKGFTPESLETATLADGQFFPCDRIFAVENGPSGYDPAAPAHVSKMKFTVLARIPQLARARTLYDDETGQWSVTVEGGPPFFGRLTTEAGRAAFAAWLAGFLEDQSPEDVYGPLKVLSAPQGLRFMDDPKGFVSVINLESVRDLEQRLGFPVDPGRFRANVWVEGWPAWSEYGLEPGVALKLGGAELRLLNDIDRCAAVHVDPRLGVKDLDLVPALFAELGHICCGIYAEVTAGGPIKIGDPAGLTPL